MEINIKKVLKTIYKFDFTKLPPIISHGSEFFVSDNGISEFNQTFKKQDLDNGIVVTPSGYTKGLFYSSLNDGEIYSSVKYEPDVVYFSFNIFGLKHGAYYRVRIPARSAGSSELITDNRELLVLTEDQEVVIQEDLKDVYENTEYQGIFRSQSNEINLLFSIGKIYVSDIIIEEVELLTENVSEEESETIDTGKLQLGAYGVFNMKTLFPEGFKGKYIQVTRLTGKGISLYYNRADNTYVLERDNSDDILQEPFTLLNYVVEINSEKIPGVNHMLRAISAEPGPNTLKAGYLSFNFVNAAGETVDISKLDGNRLYVFIKKLY